MLETAPVKWNISVIYEIRYTLLNTNHSAITNGDLAKLRTFLITNCVINACTSFSAAFGNGIVLMTIWKSPSLHSPSNTLLFGLALTDFSVGMFIQPMEVAKCLFSLLTKEGSPKELNSAFDVLSVILIGGLSCDSNFHQYRSLPHVLPSHALPNDCHNQKGHRSYRVWFLNSSIVGISVDARPL